MGSCASPGMQNGRCRILDYTSRLARCGQVRLAVPARSGARQSGQKRDFRLAPDIRNLVDGRPCAGTNDLVVQVLRAGLRGTDEEAARDRNGIEPFPRTLPSA